MKNHRNKLVIPYSHTAINKRSLTYTDYRAWSRTVVFNTKLNDTGK